MLEYILALLAGAAMGAALRSISAACVHKRTDDRTTCPLLHGKRAWAVWSSLNAAAWLMGYISFGIGLYAVEWLFAVSACLVISVVDYCTRRIPNGALVALLLMAAVMLLINPSWARLWDRLLGMLIGSVVFLLPYLIKKQAGLGDLKFAATMGLYLGFTRTVVALGAMSIVFLLYAAVFLAMRKGDRKSTVAFGPYISAGFVITMAIL